MPMWRCPHCGTPQAETSRCWVCKRSSTSCGTCRHFRRSVAAQLGYCGLDRQRRPLRGDEIRACWEAAAAVDAAGDGPPVQPPAFVAGRAADRAAPAVGVGPAPEVAVIPRGFVPVGTAETSGESWTATETAAAARVVAAPPHTAASEPSPVKESVANIPSDPTLRVGLWGDLDRG
jgi:hypothetical protein